MAAAAGDPAEDLTTSEPLEFTEDGQSLLVITSLETDTGRLLRDDLATKAVEVLAEDPEADVDGVVLHPDTREPQIVTVEKDREEFIVLDPAIEADLKAVRALHPGDPSISGREYATSPWLVAFTNDAGPVAYYVYDPAAHTGRFLFDARPELNRYQLAAMEPFSFTSRDGLTIHGYATFPPGAAGGTCRRCSTCMAARGSATRGAGTPRRSGWPTAVTCASRSTTAAPPGTARTS